MDNKIKEKIYPLIKKLKADKKSLLIILIGFVGMLLIAFSGFEEAEETEETYSHTYENFSQQEQKEELESIIGDIAGVGRVKVMITYECSNESVFARNMTENKEETVSKTVSEYIVVENGNNEEGLLIKEVYPVVKGIAVVCDGGDNPTVKNEITMMLKAVFGISSNNISVTAMQS